MRHVSRKQRHTTPLPLGTPRPHACTLPSLYVGMFFQNWYCLHCLYSCSTYNRFFIERMIVFVSFQEKDETMTVATFILAATLEPGGLLMWLLVGLVAGFL